MKSLSYSLALFQKPNSDIWHVRANIHAPHRRQVTKSLGTTDKAVAESTLKKLENGGADSWLALKIQDMDARSAIQQQQNKDAADKLDDLIDWYLDTRLVVIGRKEKTIGNYKRLLGDFYVFCGTRNIGRMQQLSSKVIEEWKAWHIRVKERPANRHEIMQLRQFINDACEIHELDTPRIRWDIPKKGANSKYKALTEQQLNDFLVAFKTLEPGAYDIVAWVALTGWRIGDVYDLRWSEVNLVENYIDRAQLKTANKLLWPISPAMREVLDRQASDGQFVFTKPKYTVCQKKLARFCGKLEDGVFKPNRWDRNVSFRDLRKTFGTLMARKGCPPHILRELMGHKSLEMTLQYYVEADLEGMAVALGKHQFVKRYPKSELVPIESIEDCFEDYIGDEFFTYYIECGTCNRRIDVTDGATLKRDYPDWGMDRVGNHFCPTCQRVKV